MAGAGNRADAMSGEGDCRCAIWIGLPAAALSRGLDCKTPWQCVVCSRG